MSGGKRAQMCLRGSTIHVQFGTTNDYEKFDVGTEHPDYAALVSYILGQLKAGNSGNSLAGTLTKYVPVKVREKQEFYVTPSPSPTPPEIIIR